MSARYALVNSSGATVNVVLWDGVTPYTPPAGTTLVPEAQAPTYSPATAAQSVIGKPAFLARFTAAEMTAIAGAAETNPGINLWLITAEAHDQIDLADPLTKQGLDALVATGLISAARETAILTP